MAKRVKKQQSGFLAKRTKRGILIGMGIRNPRKKKIR